MRLIKIQGKTYNLLKNIIKAKEKREPILKGKFSFDTIIQFLLKENKIKLSKYQYLKRLKD